MDILLRSARIIDPSQFSRIRILDILIRNGVITTLGKDLKNPSRVRELFLKNSYVSPGWFDLYAGFCDPGYEYKEDLQSGSIAAAAGGFTGVALRPDTNPVLDNKGGIEYILNASKGNIVDIFPYGAVSQNRGGSNMTEMIDMAHAGAIAFTDADKPIADTGLMMRSLLYSKGAGKAILNFPKTSSLSPDAQMNEGEASVRLGMAGEPALSEELMVNRDIYLSEYTNTSCHLLKISAAGSVALLKRAKAKGIQVTASVTAYHLLLDENVLDTYDSNYKLTPSLRTPKDRRALIKGLKDGSIDVICSDHNPQDIDAKRKEFTYSEYGMINLETAFAVANTALHNQLPISRIIEILAVNPRKILGLPIPQIAEGQKANLTIFDPKQDWIVQKEDIKSKSANTPFIGMKLIGKPLGIINNNQLFVHKI